MSSERKSKRGEELLSKYDQFSSTASSSTTTASPDGLFEEFYTEVKEIEKRDSVLTSKQQIDRLLRPGSTYFNLNPFEVLQLDFDTPLDQIKTKYRRMSILVHPDKNQDDKERAQAAFDAVNRAWRTLEDNESRAKCMEIVEEARERTLMNVAERKRKQSKDKDKAFGPSEEDSPAGIKKAISTMTMKLFADYERKRRNQIEREQEEKKRKREEELENEEKLKLEREWCKNFEESREGRVQSWKNFSGLPPGVPSSSSSSHKKKKSGNDNDNSTFTGFSGSSGVSGQSGHSGQLPTSSSSLGGSALAAVKVKSKKGAFRPPKHKAESRN